MSLPVSMPVSLPAAGAAYRFHHAALTAYFAPAPDHRKARRVILDHLLKPL